MLWSWPPSCPDLSRRTADNPSSEHQRAAEIPAGPPPIITVSKIVLPVSGCRDPPIILLLFVNLNCRNLSLFEPCQRHGFEFSAFDAYYPSGPCTRLCEIFYLQRDGTVLAFADWLKLGFVRPKPGNHVKSSFRVRSSDRTAQARNMRLELENITAQPPLAQDAASAAASEAKEALENGIKAAQAGD